MELALNLAWALLSLLMVWQWVRCPPRSRAERGLQLVALGVLIAILLPQISISDDLQSICGPAEVRSSESRRGEAWANPHSTAPPTTHSVFPTPALLEFAPLSFGYQTTVLPQTFAPLTPVRLALVSIQNRPPPTA